MRYLTLPLALLVLAIALLSGCGGGGGGTPVEVATTGSLGIHVDWPPLPEVQTQLIPTASNSIKVEILRDGQVIAGKVVVVKRPETSARIDSVPVGPAVMRATAYPQSDASGVAQATASIAITVLENTYSEFPITMQSTIATVAVTPAPADVAINGQQQLHATARNANGKIVLVPTANAFNWSVVSGGSCLTLSPNGLVKGLVPGSAVVRATEKESGKSGTVTVNVLPEQSEATLQAAMAVPFALAPVPGSPENLALLQAWDTDANLPRNEARLREQLLKFIKAATANRNDSAAQLGLALTTLAIAGFDAATYLGEDPFERLDIKSATKDAFSKALRVDQASSQAMNVAALRATPTFPKLIGAKVTTLGKGSKLPSVGTLSDYRKAMGTYLVPALKNIKERLAAVADLATPGTKLVSLQVTGEGTYTLYAADFNCLAALINLLRTPALMVYALNPDYGGYVWDLTNEERDGNHDGVLTPAEYAPSAPFANLDAAAWSGAGDALADAVNRLQKALQSRPTGDANDGVNRALRDADITEVNNYLADARALLAGTVNVTATWSLWANTQRKEIETGTMLIPLNLRELWSNPPTGFRSWLPSLYSTFDATPWDGISFSSGDLYVTISSNWDDEQGWHWCEQDLIAGTATYHVNVVNDGTTVFDAPVTVALGPAPYVFNLPAGNGFPGGQLRGNADLSVLQGTNGGSPVTLNRETGQSFTRDFVGTWDALPDKSFSGLFPDPAKVKLLLAGDYDWIRLQYNTLDINKSKILPVLTTP